MTVAEVDAVAQVFHDGVAARNVGMVVDLYHDDARLLAPGFEPAEGKPAIQATLQALLDMGATSLDIEPLDVREGGDLTVEYGRYRLGIEADGASMVDLGKYIVVHETRDGETKIVLDCFNSNAPPPGASSTGGRSAASTSQTAAAGVPKVRELAGSRPVGLAAQALGPPVALRTLAVWPGLGCAARATSESGGRAMHRLRGFGGRALAVAVSVVAAGPAVAAKGGNSDNAHACQQGGHENRFEAETGSPFKNAGDCASHGAKGGASSSLQILTSPTYSCRDFSKGCFGVVTGSGLKPQEVWAVIALDDGNLVASGLTELDGSLTPTKLDVGCGGGAGPLEASAMTPAGQQISSLSTPPAAEQP